MTKKIVVSEEVESPVIKKGETRAYEKYPPATPFCNNWNASESLKEAAEKNGMTVKRATAYATVLRKRNVKCKKFTPGRK